MLVRDAMTANPITVTLDASHPQIADLMRERKIRRVPVVDNGRLAGIISDRDILSTMPSPATTLSRWEINTLLDKLKAKDIMSSPVYVVDADCPLEEAGRVLLDKKIGGLPVMEGDELVGIITETDFFRALVDLMSGGDAPGLRFTLRAERQRGLLAQLASIVNANGGFIISLTTLNEPDGIHKRVLVKEEGADPIRVRAALEAADIEVLDVRPRRQCTLRALP